MTLGRPLIEKTLSSGLDVVSLPLVGATEHQITMRPLPGETVPQAVARLVDAAGSLDAAALKLTAFGDCGARAEAAGLLSALGCPITWVEGAECWGLPLAGIIAHCVSGADVARVELDGAVAGSTFADGEARYAILAGIHPSDLTVDRPAQAREAFLRMEAGLRAAGMDFHDVARTWLFVDRILDWYDDLNPVRTQFFRERDLFSGLVPASTGVGVANPLGAAMACEVLALKGADVSTVLSPLQCSARDYGSSFSRAVEIETPGLRRLIISGTASIAREGHTEHLGDTAAQIALTFDVVEAILASRGMDFGDATRSIAYFRHPADAPLFAEFLEVRGLPTFPVVVAQADICRDDLLFEIELDAATTVG